MRTPLILAPILATALAGPAAGAQRAQRTVTVSVTVTEPLQVRVDAAAATLRATRDGMRLTVRVRTWGAGSPVVAVRHGGGESRCETVASAARTAAHGAGEGAVVLCVLPRPAAGEGAVYETSVTLVVSAVN
jgi:hypothetical protein